MQHTQNLNNVIKRLIEDVIIPDQEASEINQQSVFNASHVWMPA